MKNEEKLQRRENRIALVIAVSIMAGIIVLWWMMS